MAFVDFRNDVMSELAARKITNEMVDFVNIGGSLWTTIDDFETLESCLPGRKIDMNDSGMWSHVPRSFAVVLKDERWLHYNECRDPTYCKWQMFSLPTRAKNQRKPCVDYAKGAI